MMFSGVWAGARLGQMSKGWSTTALAFLASNMFLYVHTATTPQHDLRVLHRMHTHSFRVFEDMRNTRTPVDNTRFKYATQPPVPHSGPSPHPHPSSIFHTPIQVPDPERPPLSG